MARTSSGLEVEDARHVHSVSYRVFLSDGSETRATFWTYEWRDTGGSPKTVVTYKIVAEDTPAEVAWGIQARRCRERRQLVHDYEQALREIKLWASMGQVTSDGGLMFW